MGKKSDTAATGPKVEVTGTDLASLKEEGNTAFAKKEYEKAMAAWDKALTMVDGNDKDAAILHNNKAACHLMFKRYKEAVEECTSALNAQPSYFKALARRAKAYEQLGQYKQALVDLQAANKLDAANDDSKASEKRLKDLAAGKKPAGLGANGLARKQALGGAARGQNAATGRQMVFPCKISLDSDTRSLPLPPTTTYVQLMEAARQCFPKAFPFALKFLDKEGDLVTIASNADIQRSMQESIEAAQRAAGGRSIPSTFPAIRIQVIKVASEAEVPKMPEGEREMMQKLLLDLQRAQQQQNAAAQQQADQQPPPQIDEWILSFVDLLKTHCGIDPDHPLEPMEVGNEKLNAGFQAMLHDDPKALELFDSAYEKFGEQAVLGMIAQAQVDLFRADRLMAKAAKEGTAASAISKEVEGFIAKAEKKAKEAIAYKKDFPDSLVFVSQIEQKRAYLAANYLMESVLPKDDVKDPKARQEAEEAANKAATDKAAARVTKQTATKAESHFAKAQEWIEKAMAVLPEEEKKKELKAMKPMAEQIPGDPESETAPKATLLIQMGNLKYEQSLIRAAGGLDWKPMVAKAKELFEQAGAASVDIRSALKAHPLAAEMEDLIGSEPEPEKTADEAAKEAPKGGVGSLAPKPKKKDGA